jgi:hypothetical protein
MPNKNYNNGRAFEYRVRDYFKEHGKWEIFRSAGSHTKADLICLRGITFLSSQSYETDVLLVQCKTSSGLMSKKAKTEFKDYCKSLNCQCAIAYREKRKIKIEYL